MPSRAGCSLFCRHLSVRNGILASVWKDFHPPDHAKIDCRNQVSALLEGVSEDKQ